MACVIRIARSQVSTVAKIERKARDIKAVQYASSVSRESKKYSFRVHKNTGVQL